jgi:hypothetical protein
MLGAQGPRSDACVYERKHIARKPLWLVRPQADPMHAGALSFRPLVCVAGILRRFRARVDAALPGMYVWWDEASLHITIRALIP